MGVTVLRVMRVAGAAALAAAVTWLLGGIVAAQEPTAQVAPTPGGEANLILPDLAQVMFLGGVDGHTLLYSGLVVSALGLLFGLTIYTQLKHLPVHQSMREVSELIYETCKTYLLQQGKFLLILEGFVGVIIALRLERFLPLLLYPPER